MSVDAGGKPAGPGSPVAAPVRQPDLAHLLDQWAGPLLDYCDGVLPGRVAAAGAALDTLIAAQQRIGELADPDRLRSWFYALARLRCADSWPGGGTAAPADAPDGSDPADQAGGLRGPADGPASSADQPGPLGADTAVLALPDLEAEAIRQEQLQIVTAAMASLAPEDRDVLNLAFRHGLGDQELPAVLGLRLRRARALLSGAVRRFSQAATAVAALRSGLAGCQTAETIAGDWDPSSPTLTTAVRKRLARHIPSCAECTQSLKGRVFGPELLSVQPLAPVPGAFRLRVLAAGEDPEQEGYRREVAARFGAFRPGGFPVVRASSAMRRAARRRRG
jgi:DNA-directed RNA polymerase specialized sigma24 family protein